LPLQVLTSVQTKRTAMTGWVSFTVKPMKPMKRLKLQKGEPREHLRPRLQLQASRSSAGTSTRRLVSLRICTPR